MTVQGGVPLSPVVAMLALKEWVAVSESTNARFMRVFSTGFRRPFFSVPQSGRVIARRFHNSA
jgi:hypothetical protein